MRATVALVETEGPLPLIRRLEPMLPATVELGRSPAGPTDVASSTTKCQVRLPSPVRSIQGVRSGYAWPS